MIGAVESAYEGAVTRVLIIDDHELFGHILSRALEVEGIEALVMTGPTREEILASACDFRPDIVLLDLQLGPDLGDGVGLVGPLRDIQADVIILTGSADDFRRAECVEAGAAGVVRKDQPFESLVAAIRTVEAGEELTTPQERHLALHEVRLRRERDRRRTAAFGQLTPREREVLHSLGNGHSAASIAEESFVSLSTVRSQIRSVLVKLGATSQLSAVALAREAGWLS